MYLKFKNKNDQNGNILFLILIGVALFGALSYAVTNTSRGKGEGVESETELTKASVIIQHANSISVAMQRLTVIHKCDFNSIDYNAAFGNPTNYPGPCNIFDLKNGGGVSYNQYPDDAHEIFSDIINPPYPGKSILFFNTMRILGIGIDGRAESAIFYFNIDESLCKGVNNLAKIKGPIMEENTPYEGGWTNPIVASLSTNQNLTIGDLATNLVGKNFGCYKASRGGDMGHHIYYALIEH